MRNDQEDLDSTLLDDGGSALYVSERKIYPRDVDGALPDLAQDRGGGAAGHVLRVPVAALGRTPGGAVRPAGAQVLRVRAELLAAGLRVPGDAADHRRPRAVLLHRAGRTPVVRLRLPADGVDRSVPVDGAVDRGRPQRAHEARRRPVEPQQGRCARAASTCCGWCSRCGPASPSSASSPRSPTSRARAAAVRSGAAGKRSGCCSTRSRPGATPASCASRCASTCARTRASRARCSTATR